MLCTCGLDVFSANLRVGDPKCSAPFFGTTLISNCLWCDAVALSAASPLPWSRSLERMIGWPQGSSRVRVQVKECLTCVGPKGEGASEGVSDGWVGPKGEGASEGVSDGWVGSKGEGASEGVSDGWVGPKGEGASKGVSDG